MKHLILIPVIFIFSVFIINAQNIATDYDWEDTFGLSPEISDTSLQSVILKLHQIHQFVPENNSLVEYVTYHKKIKILNENSISQYNKIYIPQFNIIEFLSIKARVINPDGKVIYLNEDNIKEGVYENTDIKYNYFAVEGIEQGSEIEYLYKTKKSASFSGNAVSVQTNVNRYDFEYDVIAPQHLIYKFKTYNGLPEFKTDTLSDKKLYRWSLKCDEIPAAKEEEFSNYDSDIMRFVYKLDKIVGRKSDVMAYGPLSGRLYKQIYTTDKNEIKILQKLLSKINRDKNTLQYIRNIENYVKENFVYNNISDDNLNSIKHIVSDKVYNKSGSVKLFANLFKLAGIKHEIVLTNNRFKKRFDKDFSLYLFLDDYLIYFPQINEYMSTENTNSRVGLISYKYINNYGLFIKEVSVGEFQSAVSKVKFIPPYDFEKTGHYIEVQAEIPDDFETVKFNILQKLTGYYAYFNQPVFDFVKDKEKLDEIIKEVANIIDVDDEVENVTTENNGAVNMNIKPFIVKCDIKTDKLIENAGNKYIFKVGKLIGKQYEMYNKTVRKFDMEFNYPHYLKRKLFIKIPEGYKADNLESLKFNETFVLNNDTIFGFVSDFHFDDNQNIEVNIMEWYKVIRCDQKYFEDFKRVMNAAANFNKASLFIYKEE